MTKILFGTSVPLTDLNIHSVDEHEVYAFCSYCDENKVCLQFQDYVDYPMIWEEGCCTCKHVLLDNTIHELTLQEAQSAFPEHSKSILKYTQEPFFEDYYHPDVIIRHFYTIDCAKILRISNSQLYSNVYDGNQTEEDLRKLIVLSTAGDDTERKYWENRKSRELQKRKEQLDTDLESVEDSTLRKEKERLLSEVIATQTKNAEEQNEYFKTVEEPLLLLMNEFNITEATGRVYCNEMTIDEFTKISIQVNSYDVMLPTIPYPKNMNLEHDGICIYLLCEDNSGKQFITKYWGG